MINRMTPADLTLIAPINDLLTLSGLPQVGLEHLAVGQLALLGGDRLLAVLPARRRRRRRRGGGIGFLALCCCLVPLAAIALVAYLLWARQTGRDPRTAFREIGSGSTGGTQPPPPPGGTQPPPPPGGTQPPPPPGGTQPPPPPGGTQPPQPPEQG